jgi:hypothetical protein
MPHYRTGFLALALLYLVVHGAMLMLSFAWISIWALFVSFTADLVRTSPWYLCWFGMILCLEASLGVALGLAVMLFTIASFGSLLVTRQHLIVKSLTW